MTFAAILLHSHLLPRADTGPHWPRRIIAARPNACAGEEDVDGPEQRFQASTAAAEERISALFRELNACTSQSTDSVTKAELLTRLQGAKDELSAVQHLEMQKDCVQSLQECRGGGEAAYAALEALRCAGVPPDGSCYRAALSVCASSQEEGLLEQQGEWAELIFCEAMAQSSGGGGEVADLALRACIRRDPSATWGVQRAV